METEKPPISILNFGCSSNRAIAESLTRKLKNSGFKTYEEIIDDSVIIINTCIVKEESSSHESLILSLSVLKI